MVTIAWPGEVRMATFVIIAILLVLLLLALLRLWAFVRRENTRARRESLASIAALLRAPEKATRLYALNLLAASSLMEISALEAPLLEAQRDPEPEVRAAAGRLLGLLHPPDQLMRQLSGKEIVEKLEAIEGLAAVGTQKALSALLEAAARDPEEAVRKAARAALSRGENPETFPFLTSSLGHTDPILRATAVDIFQLCGPAGLTYLLSALRDPRKTIRAIAADILGQIAYSESAEALSTLLSDPVDEVRVHAARALGRLSSAGPGMVGALTGALSDSSRVVQEEAACAIAQLGDPAGFLPLLEFLGRRKSAFQAGPPPLQVIQFLGRNFPAEMSTLAAFRALVDSADESLLASLAKTMDQSAETVRREWLERLPSVSDESKEMLRSILVRLGKAGLREPFRRVAHDRSPAKTKVRLEVSHLLGEIGKGDFGEDIFTLLSDSDPGVRHEAAWAAGRIPHFAPVDGLCQALSDPDAEVRAEAARSLTLLTEQVRSAEGFPPETARRLVDQVGAGLLQAVNDPVNRVRAEIARALGSARLTAAIPSLVAWALGDEDAEVRAAAAEALVGMSADDVLPLIAEALSYKDASVRGRAAELLGATKGPDAVTHLIRSLYDEAAEVREKSARALWEIGATGHANALIIHLQSPDPKIRASIAGLLGKVKAQEAVGGLIHGLRDPNEFVRAAIINALSHLGAAALEALPALLERLEDPDGFVRARAIIALAAVAGNSPEVTSALSQAVVDRDPVVATEAMNALVELASKGQVEPLAEVVANPRAREIATKHLAKSEPESLRLLLKVARATKGEAQAILLGLLTETMKSVGTVEGYKQDLISVDPAIRSAALEALSLFGTEEAASIVSEVLKNDPVSAVRRRAAVILGRIPGETAQAALRYASEHDLDPEIREFAREQLVLAP